MKGKELQGKQSSVVKGPGAQKKPIGKKMWGKPRRRKDKTITCEACKKPFVWSRTEQADYDCKNFNPPLRCVHCRKAVKAGKDRRFMGKRGRAEQARRDAQAVLGKQA